MELNLTAEQYSEKVEKLFGEDGLYPSQIKKQMLLILFEKGIEPDGSIKVVKKDLLLSLLKEKSNFKSDETGLRKQIEEIRTSLRRFYLSSEGKSDEYQIDIGTRYGKGYLIVTVKRNASSMVYDFDVSIYIKICEDGRTFHRRVDYYQVLCDLLPAREHMYLQWERGNVSVCSKIFKLIKLLDKSGKSIKHLHNPRYEVMRKKEDEYYWKIIFEPPLEKGTIVKYENRHEFLRPYPMSMSEVRSGKMYQKLPFAYEGIGTQNEKSRSYLEIEFPKNFMLSDWGIFIESGFTGNELKALTGELEKKRDEHIYLDELLNANKIWMEINAPILGVTYSLKWFPPEKWDG